MANGKSDGTGPPLRISAWLPPGLALGWLAVLATFVHGVGGLLTAWAATVSLAVLLARWHPAASSAAARAGGSDQDPMPSSTASLPDRDEEARGGADSANTTENAATPTRGPDPTSAPKSTDEPAPGDSSTRSAPSATVSTGQTEQSATAEIATVFGLQVLTAAEVASVLRVDANLIVAAISNGELPGNRIGSHWRVNHGALARWLQGRYGTTTEPSGSGPSPESRANPG